MDMSAKSNDTFQGRADRNLMKLKLCEEQMKTSVSILTCIEN